jgi:hypothetical protein
MCSPMCRILGRIMGKVSHRSHGESFGMMGRSASRSMIQTAGSALPLEESSTPHRYAHEIVFQPIIDPGNGQIVTFFR